MNFCGRMKSGKSELWSVILKVKDCDILPQTEVMCHAVCGEMSDMNYSMKNKKPINKRIFFDQSFTLQTSHT